MPDYRLMYDKDHLGAWDLHGKDVTVTIEKVEAKEVMAENKKKSRRPVLTFAGKDKKMVLNVTNGKTVAELYGPETANWVGKKITIYGTTTKFGNDTRDCIRIRNVVPGEARQ